MQRSSQRRETTPICGRGLIASTLIFTWFSSRSVGAEQLPCEAVLPLSLAVAAVSLRGPTGHFAECVAKMPALQGLQNMNNWMPSLGGGLPIDLSGEVGVGESPSGHLDAGCAQAGLGRIGAAPNRFGPK